MAVQLSEQAKKRKREYDRRYFEEHPDYQNKYQKENIKKLSVNLSYRNDADIIEFIESLPRGTKDPYIKALIRKDMQNRN